MRGAQLAVLMASLVLISGWAGEANSQETRGLKVVRVTQRDGKAVELYKGSHALLIGVSDYTAGWPDLESIPGELERLEEVLREQGFSVTRVMNPDNRELKQAFEEFIDRYGYEPENRLLFFYSGHGYTRKLGTRQKGYLVPTNAPNPAKDERGFARKSLTMSQVQTWAREIEAKHALFLFDSCFSGTIFKTRALPIPRHITDKTSKPVRQFITAGSAGEEVPARSVFLPSFIRAIQGEGDINKDGYVTGTELGAFLHEKVLGYNIGQTPQYGKIRDPALDEGDFVFPLVASVQDQAVAEAEPKEQSDTPSRPKGAASPTNPEAARMLRIARLLAQRGYVEEGQQKYTELARRHPDTPEGIEAGAEVLLYRLKKEGAVPEVAGAADAFRAEHEGHPQALRVRKALLEWLMEKWRFDTAEKRLIEWEAAGSQPEAVESLYETLALKKAQRQRTEKSIRGAIAQGDRIRAETLLYQEGKNLPAAMQLALKKEIFNLPWRDPVTGMVLVQVPGGSFDMGCHSGNAGECNGDEKPVRTVRLDGFWMGRHEVTQGQWKRIMGSTPSVINKGDDYPVETVSWNDVQGFIQKLNGKSEGKYRLPSEAEWEYACRAGGEPIRFGTATGSLDRRTANYGADKCCKGDSSDGHMYTAPVGSYDANALGVYDMSGNVWEWVQDKYADYGNVGANNPIYEGSGADRVIRGGSWYYVSRYLRCSIRNRYQPSGSFNSLGFRLLRIR